jgi:formylglycine-generating enzyme required for sulfatase activity
MTKSPDFEHDREHNQQRLIYSKTVIPRLAIIAPLVLLLQQVVLDGHTGRTETITPALSESVWIPSGEFLMGSSRDGLAYAVLLCSGVSPRPCLRRHFLSETPSRHVRTRGYHIGTTEVSNAQYEACLRSGGCPPRSQHRPDERFDGPELPVVDVTFEEALSYCRWRGGRLPSEAEWERAARGPRRRRFPWGDIWNSALANHGRSTIPHHEDSDGYRYLAPVTAYPEGRSPYGLFNMAGNVWEWVSDWYDESSYTTGGTSDPTGPSFGQTRVIRGGSWATPAFALRVTMRAQAIETDRSIDVGFRCLWEE